MPTKTTERGRSCKEIVMLYYVDCYLHHLLHDVDIQVQLWEGDLAREVPGCLPDKITSQDCDQTLVPRHEQWSLRQGAAQERFVDKH